MPTLLTEIMPVLRALRQATNRGGLKPGAGVLSDRQAAGRTKPALEKSASTDVATVTGTPTQITHVPLQQASWVASV